MKKTITVFGSSIPCEGDEEYLTAYSLGQLLAHNGFSLCTGGYSGIMEAVSRGAAENDAEVIGVTMAEWESLPNKYLTKNIVCEDLFKRIQTLVQLGDGFVILKGGTGTLLELAAVWEFMNKNVLPVKPVVCHSIMWKHMIELMEVQIKTEKRRPGLIKYFDEINEIAAYLLKSVKLEGCSFDEH